MAYGAVNTHGIIILPLPLLGVLGPETVQNVKNLPSLLQRLYHIVLVFAAAVHMGLVPVVHFDAELLDGSLKFLLKIFRKGSFCRAERVGRVRVGSADIFLHVLADFLYIHRNLTDSVILVPGKQKLCLPAFSLQGLYHKQTGGDIPEISDMDGTGRTDARRAYILFLVRIPADDFFRYSV